MYVEAAAGAAILNITVQFGDVLPDEVIAVAPGSMNWGLAVSYCTDQGGRLPSNSYLGLTSGTVPSGNYWSGVKGGAADAWILYSNGTSLSPYGYREHKVSGSLQVLCVS